MAEMKWTKEQQQVIDARGRNLLVSAAAGSGKTAVLVERIVRMVTDPDHPVDIDRLLVMTFTNAAAAEMRERIGDALEKRLEEEPGDRNLERQTSLIHHARITTIDSFCLKLLREHFNELDIDPGFRIGDEGELLLLQADVMKELLEDYYGREDGRFLRFVDTYASGKADGGLEDYILQVWRFSQSNPWPGQWIAACKKELSEETDGDLDGLENAEWMRFLVRDVKRQAGEFAEQLAEALETAGEENGPQAYIPMLQEDLRAMERLSEASEEELTAVGDIGKVSADCIRSYFSDEKNQVVMQRLAQAGVNMTAEESETVDSVISGKTLVVTGTLPTLGRKEAQTLIERYGGKVSGSVSKKTDYVLAGESAGSKLTKAQELGIRVISEDELYDMLQIER